MIVISVTCLIYEPNNTGTDLKRNNVLLFTRPDSKRPSSFVRTVVFFFFFHFIFFGRPRPRAAHGVFVQIIFRITRSDICGNRIRRLPIRANKTERVHAGF